MCQEPISPFCTLGHFLSGSAMEIQSLAEILFDLVPYCQEGESAKEAKIAPKLSHQRGERVEQDFFLNLSFTWRRRKHHNRRSGNDFWAAFNPLVLFVLARLLASGRLHNLLSIGIHQPQENLFKSAELFRVRADRPVLSTQLIPGKPTFHFLWKVLLDTDGEVVAKIFFTRSSVKIESFVVRQGDVVVVARSIHRVSVHH